jgi:catechol 2,3-dioxygenase-like lactoylglutathione lyase family enzyme
MKVESLDHIVLTVHDLDATIAFYTKVLGMKAETFGQGRKGLSFGAQKINLHRAGHEFEPKAGAATPGSADFCLITSEPLTQFIEHLRNSAVPIVVGPLKKIGATGPLLSVYIRDPDGNLVEISNRQSASV